MAIQNGQQGAFVYVVDDASKVHMKTVQIGVTTDTSTDILSGVSDGDRVVVDGTDRLVDGAVVQSPASRRDGQPGCRRRQMAQEGAVARAGW